MDRVRSAILLPIIVFPAAAIVAVAIGLLLHLVKDVTCDEICERARTTHEMVSPLGDFATPAVALLLVIIITAAGFIAAGTGPSPSHHE